MMVTQIWKVDGDSVNLEHKDQRTGNHGADSAYNSYIPHTMESGPSTLFAGEASFPSSPLRTSWLPPLAGTRVFACNTNTYGIPSFSGRPPGYNTDTYLELSLQRIDFSLVRSRLHPDDPLIMGVASPRTNAHQGEPLIPFDVHQFKLPGLCQKSGKVH